MHKTSGKIEERKDSILYKIGSSTELQNIRLARNLMKTENLSSTIDKNRKASTLERAGKKKKGKKSIKKELCTSINFSNDISVPSNKQVSIISNSNKPVRNSNNVTNSIHIENQYSSKLGNKFSSNPKLFNNFLTTASNQTQVQEPSCN